MRLVVAQEQRISKGLGLDRAKNTATDKLCMDNQEPLDFIAESRNGCHAVDRQSRETGHR